MGKDKRSGSGGGRQRAGLPGGEVKVLGRQPGVVVAER